MTILVVFMGLLFIVMACSPLVLTVMNLVFLIKPEDEEDKKWREWSILTEFLTIVLGVICTCFAVEMFDVRFNAEWVETLINSEMHTPISSVYRKSIAAVGIAAAIGYILLLFKRMETMPPLVIVFTMSSVYLGIALCMTWIVQMFNGQGIVFCIFPANLILMSLKRIRIAIRHWNAQESRNREYHGILNLGNRLLRKTWRWPFAAFLLMWPLLGILVCILVLFGQQPDALIKVWTETSDWNLSRRQAPQNVFEDEHYLCTVAAGGHKKLVKPLRLGVRHGHEVIVNRQLCVANAFEQILEERTPGFHRRVRYIYDTYGFPIAKMIHSPYIADIVYLLMKPLEWLFLIVLYSCDVNPENRIAVQYLPGRVEDLIGKIV